MEFTTMALFVLLGHSLDLLSTYIQNPSLSREVGGLWLKLVSLGRDSWPLLITYKYLYAAITILAYSLVMRARRRFYPERPGCNLHDFLHAMHGKEAVYRPDGHWIMPSPRLLLLWFVYIVTIGGAVYAWTLSIHNSVGSPPWLDLTGKLVTCVVCFFGFWTVAWHEYRDAAPAESTLAGEESGR